MQKRSAGVRQAVAPRRTHARPFSWQECTAALANCSGCINLPSLICRNGCDEADGPAAGGSIHQWTGPAGRLAGRGGARHATTRMGVVPRVARQRVSGSPAAGQRRAVPSPPRSSRRSRRPDARLAARGDIGLSHQPATSGADIAGAAHFDRNHLDSSDSAGRAGGCWPGWSSRIRVAGSARCGMSSPGGCIGLWRRLEHPRMVDIQVASPAVRPLCAALQAASIHMVPVRSEADRMSTTVAVGSGLRHSVGPLPDRPGSDMRSARTGESADRDWAADMPG